MNIFLARFICAFLQIAGLVLYASTKMISVEFIPVAMAGCAISGFAGFLQMFLSEKFEHYTLFVGLAGLGILLMSLSELVP